MFGSTSHMRLALAILFVSVAIFPGCGSSEERPERAPRTVRLNPATEVGGFRGRGRAAEGRNTCRRARVVVGPSAGAIDFVARCSGSRVDDVTFVLQRHRLADLSQKEAILGYRRFPRVKGRGGLSRYGRCDLKQEVLTCTAKIDGPVVISGRLWVESESRCAVTVFVTGITVPRCHASACAGVPKLDELFRGRPRGC